MSPRQGRGAMNPRQGRGAMNPRQGRGAREHAAGQELLQRTPSGTMETKGLSWF